MKPSKKPLLTSFALLISLFAFGQTESDFAALTPAQWQKDIDYFAEQLVKRHKNAFHTVSQEEFQRDVNLLRHDAPSLKPYQIIVRLLQITAKVGDGHTAVHLPTWFKRYPLALNWFSDSLYVTGASAVYKEAVGARVTKIGGRPMDEVTRKIATVLSQAENKWYDMNTGAFMMSNPSILETLGIVADYNSASYTFVDSNDKEITLDISPVPTVPTKDWISAAKSVPLFRQKLNDPFWFSYLEDIQAVYVNWKSYDDLNKNTKALFDLIDEKKATRLIVDLRFNGGGDFFKGRRLVSRIKENSTIDQKDHLFLICGRRTFSAAMVNTIDFKKETNATILGEPPGERPNSYSENDEMKLPNSGLVVSYSVKYYKFLDEDVPAFEPDVRIDPDWNDFKEGRDGVMEWIVAKCKK